LSGPAHTRPLESGTTSMESFVPRTRSGLSSAEAEIAGRNHNSPRGFFVLQWTPAVGMVSISSTDITQLLQAWTAGDPHALERLPPLVYEELRRIARCHIGAERHGRTLETTALVNEAYIRLVDSSRVRWEDRAHFFAMSSQLMRRILVDAARARGSVKRWGPVE